MLKARDFRKAAWNKLSGNWAIAVLACLITSALIGVSGIVFVGPLIVTGPLTLGCSILILKIVRGEKPQLGTLFDGFNDIVRSFVLWLTNTILIALWSILLVIPGIIKSLSYSMSYFILYDNPGMTANEARKKSMELMRGNKWRLFCLYLSFIGWFLLCGITFGILTLWVSPYLQTAQAEFYESLRSPAEKAIAAESAS